MSKKENLDSKFLFLAICGSVVFLIIAAIHSTSMSIGIEKNKKLFTTSSEEMIQCGR